MADMMDDIPNLTESSGEDESDDQNEGKNERYSLQRFDIYTKIIICSIYQQND